MHTDWRKATSLNTVPAYKEIILQYPRSSLADSARNRIAGLGFRDARRENTIAAYEGFLRSYPRSSFSPTARSLVDSLERAWLARDLRDAVDIDSLEQVESLIAQGAPVNDRDNDGLTALHHACSRSKMVAKTVEDISLAPGIEAFVMEPQGYIDVVMALVEAGADVNAVDGEGKTPLHHSAFLALVDVSGFLIDRGALTDIADRKGMTPLKYADMIAQLGPGTAKKKRASQIRDYMQGHGRKSR